MPPDDTTTPATPPATDATSPAPSGVPRATVVLVVVATLLATLTALTTWVRVQAMDTDEWVEVSTELLAEPDVQEALSVYIVDQLFRNIDLAGELEEALPPVLDPLAAPFAGLFREPAITAVDRVLGSDQFATVWEEANRTAHGAAMAVLRGEDLSVATTAEGTITLHLRTAVISLGEDIGVPQPALDRIPEDAATIVVFQSDDLAAVQALVRVLEFLGWFLFLVVVGLYAAAVWLARDRWPRALVDVGLGLAVGGVVLLLLRRIAVQQGVNLVIQDPVNRGVGEIAMNLGTQLLAEMAMAGLAYGLIALLVGWLVGEHRWAVSARRGLHGWADSTVLVATTAVLAVLGFVAWSPGLSLQRWVSAVVLLAMVVAAVVVVAARVRRDDTVTTPR